MGSGPALTSWPVASVRKTKVKAVKAAEDFMVALHQVWPDVASAQFPIFTEFLTTLTIMSMINRIGLTIGTSRSARGRKDPRAVPDIPRGRRPGLAKHLDNVILR